MRAFLAGQQAHSAARVGNATEALRFMNEAEKAMDVAESQSKAFGSYDPAALMYHLSQVCHELGDDVGAVHAMRESTKFAYPQYRRTRVRHNSLTAERQLDIGHLEAACASWDRALDDYPLVQSGRCDAKMRTMVARLSPHANNSHVKKLFERARASGVNLPA